MGGTKGMRSSSVWLVGNCLAPYVLDPRQKLLGLEDARQRVDVSNHVVIARLVGFLERPDRLAEGEPHIRHRHVVLPAEVEQIRSRQEPPRVDLGDAHGTVIILLEIYAEQAREVVSERSHRAGRYLSHLRVD